MLSDLTIVCVTCNRQNYLKRVIENWQTNFSECKLYIIDGSDNILSEKIRSTIKINNLKYYYYKQTSYFYRWKKIHDLIDTKYFQLVADDEIFLKSAVDKCINFLDCNNDYTSCMGETLLFDVFNKNEILAYYPYKLYSNESIDDYERVKNWLNFTQPNTIYAIKRSLEFKKVLKEISKFDEDKFSKPENIIEDLSEIGISYLGKTKNIKELMWMRSIENARIHYGSDIYKPEFFLFNKKFLEKKKEFDSFIERYLENISKKKLLEKNKTFKNDYYKRLIIIRQNKTKNIIKKIFNFYYLIKILKMVTPLSLKIYIKKKYILKKNEILKSLELNDNNIIFSKTEIEIFKKTIINFHNEK